MRQRSALDRAIEAVSPRWAAKREHARLVLGKLHRVSAEYDGATQGRRSTSWRRKVRDANAELSPRTMMALRGISHDLVRNNPHASSGVAAHAEHIVGEGITFQLYRDGKHDPVLTAKVRAHLDGADCDAAGRHDLYGLQLQAAKAIVTGGAIVMRRRWRRASDRLPLPFQLQLLEADYIDMGKHGPLADGGYIINGIEFDQLGRRRGYWLYSNHPGSIRPGSSTSKFVPASDVAHVFRADRPEQEHGVPWLAPVILRMKDFADYEDAQGLRQKIAACFAAFRFGDPDSAEALANDNDEDDDSAELESIEPGMIYDMPGDGKIEFANPPTVDGYKDYSSVSLHAISAGLGVPYEIMTGDLSGVSFISGRLGRLNFYRKNATHQWLMFIPQFCGAVQRWTFDALDMMGEDLKGVTMRWTPPRVPMLDPASEVPAIRDAIRSGQMTPSEAVRERGHDPDTFFTEWAEDAQRFDALGLTFDSDPRKVTAVGNAVSLDKHTEQRDAK
ncbi:phage portal protein [Sphingomonas sp. SRS2]|uniref:phage portal protein n=1 Tax=Sphingomonas sp. SRS2 TaxID=133190 RepID=UPI0006183ED8|nr:phage portal protein [Sphingomonas sp. SRS2]KKC24859.1 portal protein [Sphingomonas sp. SRS2]